MLLLKELSSTLRPIVEAIADVNGVVNGFVWGSFGIGLLLAAGILMTLVNRGFQFTHISHWFKNTIGAIFSDRHVTAHTEKDDKSISQFQSLCTALAATIGTGNIVGIATAIISGGTKNNAAPRISSRQGRESPLSASQI